MRNTLCRSGQIQVTLTHLKAWEATPIIQLQIEIKFDIEFIKSQKSLESHFIKCLCFCWMAAERIVAFKNNQRRHFKDVPCCKMMQREGFYIRVRGKAWGLGELGWYVGICCGSCLIHHTAGELFNAWQAPWSLVNRINKISISQKMKASCHKLFQ